LYQLQLYYNSIKSYQLELQLELKLQLQAITARPVTILKILITITISLQHNYMQKVAKGSQVWTRSDAMAQADYVVDDDNDDHCET